MTNYSSELEIAIEAVEVASIVTSYVHKDIHELAKTREKGDLSPVTIADVGAQAVICCIISNKFPNDKIIAEEELTLQDSDEYCNSILELVKMALKDHPLADKIHDRDTLMQYVNLGTTTNSKTGRVWTIDPIDGTLGYISGGQYSICLAMMDEGIVQLGILGCPELSLQYNKDDSPKGSLLWATKNGGSWQRQLNNKDSKAEQLHVSNQKPDNSIVVALSCGRHSKTDISHELFKKYLSVEAAPIRMDSQAKYALIARGEADVYLRAQIETQYIEKIWDHAAGNILITESGGEVYDFEGNDLDFSCGRKFERFMCFAASPSWAKQQVQDTLFKIHNYKITE